LHERGGTLQYVEIEKCSEHQDRADYPSTPQSSTATRNVFAMVGCNVSSTEKAKCASTRELNFDGAALVLRRDLSYRKLLN
jgi:hypothetical protein